MYTDFPEFHLISPTGLMMNDLHLSSYLTKKGSDDVKYFLPKKRQKYAPYNLASEWSWKK